MKKCRKHFYKTGKCIWATFMAWPFSYFLNFSWRDNWVTTATCKYCLLVVSPSGEVLCKFLPSPIVTKSSILNVEEFLDPPLKILPCMKTSLVSYETSLFSHYFKMWPPLSKVIVFFCYFLLSSFFDSCYHYLVFMDLVNGYSKLKLLVKEQVSFESKITFGYMCLFYFCYPSFLLLWIFIPPVNVQLKQLNPLC